MHVPVLHAVASPRFKMLGLEMWMKIGNVSGDRLKNVLIGGSLTLRRDGSFSLGSLSNRSCYLNGIFFRGAKFNARFWPAVKAYRFISQLESVAYIGVA